MRLAWQLQFPGSEERGSALRGGSGVELSSRALCNTRFTVSWSVTALPLLLSLVTLTSLVHMRFSLKMTSHSSEGKLDLALESAGGALEKFRDASDTRMGATSLDRSFLRCTSD